MRSNLSAKIPGLITRSLSGNVWGLALNAKGQQLVLDVREEQTKRMTVVRFSWPKLQMESYDEVVPSWWCQLLSAVDNTLTFCEYLDAGDPTKSRTVQVDIATKIRSFPDSYKLEKMPVTQAHTYEEGTEYHQLVSRFLALELPLSCEYIEVGSYIVISYYLRVKDAAFERYLLILQDGQKVGKLKQDAHIRGFSPGAFFVWNNQLIFIKDRNEICIYPF